MLSLYEREFEDRLSKDEYAWLAERGYVKTNGDYDGHFKSSWQIVILENREIKDKLLAVGERIKEKYKDEFDALKAPYFAPIVAMIGAVFVCDRVIVDEFQPQFYDMDVLIYRQLNQHFLVCTVNDLESGIR